jgi:hypothetical protein
VIAVQIILVNKNAQQGMREHSVTHLAKQPTNNKSPGRKTAEAFAQTKKKMVEAARIALASKNTEKQVSTSLV